MTTDTPATLLVDSAAAAKMLSVSQRTIGRLQACGEIKHVRIGRAVRFAVSELERFIADRQRGAEQDRRSLVG